MLASFVVYLTPNRVAPLGRSIGKSLHGLFLHLVRQASPELSERLHERKGVKPFTVSPLRGEFSRVEDALAVTPDRTYWVRYTTLSEEVFNALAEILLGKFFHGQQVSISRQAFNLVDIGIEPEKNNRWGRLSSYQALYEANDQERSIALGFYSPTTFRQGKLNLLFPLPLSVFGSYVRKWRAFSGLPLSEDLLDFVAEQVAAEEHTLQSRVVHYGPSSSVGGFTGHCRYRILADDPQKIRELNVLAEFAFFAGTGRMTTMGMGQTRRLGAKPENQVSG